MIYLKAGSIEPKENTMYFIKNILTEREIACAAREISLQKIIARKGYRLITTTRDDKGNTILWVTTK